MKDEPVEKPKKSPDEPDKAKTPSKLIPVETPKGESKDNLRRRGDWFRRRSGTSE